MTLKIEVDGEKIQTILDALMDQFGILAMPYAVAEALAMQAINRTAILAKAGDTAELEALARKVTEYEIEE